MMSAQVRSATVAMQSMSCEAQCLVIIGSISPLYKSDKEKFFKEVTKANAQLRNVLISTPTADQELRHKINRTVGSEHSPGSFSATTTISFILEHSC